MLQTEKGDYHARHQGMLSPCNALSRVSLCNHTCVCAADKQQRSCYDAFCGNTDEAIMPRYSHKTFRELLLAHATPIVLYDKLWTMVTGF